jgi:uncharacterized protein
LVSPETVRELTRVLSYSKFRLSEQYRVEALALYLPYCENLDSVPKCPIQCRDPKDQPFLDLAQRGNAFALVTGDDDLLVLAGQTSFLIETPERYRQRVPDAMQGPI